MKRHIEMKVAIVYDRVNKWGGAERVLLALHDIYPQAPLYTSVYDSRNAKWAKVFPEIKTSFLQYIPFAKSNHEFLATLMPFAFKSFSFENYDLVISVTSEFAKGVRVPKNALHICYCLTPVRYLWSGLDFYFDKPPSKFKFIPFFKPLSKPLISFLKKIDKKDAKNPDRIIAISKEVKNRIKKYYSRDSTVIYPPVNTGRLGDVKASKRKNYLIVNRLIPYKRVDLAIKVFNKLGSPLYIVGTGTEENRLKSVASDNIVFKNYLTDKQLSNVYNRSKALIMPQIEDFGIVSVEAQTHGVPVIAYKKGGAIDTVIEGKTGIFFNKQTPSSLEKAIKRFENSHFIADNLHTNAQKFSKENFKRNFVRIVENEFKRRKL